MTPALAEAPSSRTIVTVTKLGIDFKEFYDSKEVKAKNVKYQDQIREKAPKLNPNDPDSHQAWFIGDAISDILYVRLDIDINAKINKVLMETIDSDIKKLYNFYDALGSDSKYVAIPGLMHDGKPVYRKMK